MKYIANKQHMDVRIGSGERVTVRYKDPRGKEHTATVSAQHLVFLIEHGEQGGAIIASPGLGTRFIEP